MELDSQPTATVTVAVATSTGSDADVTVSPTSLTFTTGNWGDAQTVTVSAAQDADADNDAATVEHTVSGGDYGANNVEADDVTVTVNDDETASSSVTLSVNPTTVAEDVGTSGQVVTVTATVNAGARTTPTSVTVSVAGGTASAGDFAAVSDITVTIAAQATSGTGTFTLKPVDDDVDESDETVIVSGTVTGLTVTGTTVTITDDDEATFALSVSAATIAEDGGTSTVTLSTGGVSFTANKTFVLTLGGNATKDTDYTVGSESLTLTVGNTSATTTITATDDKVDENNETITVSARLDGRTVGSQQTVIITDDERGVTINPTSLTVTEGSSETYTVKLDSEPTANVTVTVDGASGDVSVSGSPMTFTSSNWNTAQTVTVSVAEDEDAVNDAAVTLTHTVSGGDYGSVTASNVVVTITENDTPTLSIAAASAGESDGSMAFTVMLSVASSSEVTVTYATSNGTATAGEDYTAVTNGSLTFSPNGSLTQTITVNVTDDDIDEANETFTVTLSSPQNATIATATATGTITDDDTRGVTVDPTALTVTEGSSKTYEVELDSQPTATVTVAVATSGDSDADVTVSPTRLTFTTSNWSTAQTVTVSAAQDADAENDSATVKHTVSGGDYGDNNVEADDVSVTVNDDETASTSVTLSVSPTTVAENVGPSGQEITVTAALDAGALTTPTTVTVSVAAGTASSGDFASVSDITVTIAAQATSGTGTFTLKPVDDSVAESNETVTVSGTASGLSVTGTTVTITDNDEAAFSLSVSDATIDENGGTSTVTLSTGGVSFTENKTFALTLSGTATKGTDYTVGSESLTLTVGNTSVTTTITATDDKVDEENENITVAARLDGNVVGSSQTVTITDDDTRGVTVNPTALTVTEGGSNTYTVKLDSEPTANVTVTVGGESGDVSVSGSPMTFSTSNWSTAQTVTVNAAEDPDAVNDPSVTLTHAVSGGDFGSVTAADVVVTIAENDTPTLSIAPASAGESDDSMAFTVTLCVASSNAVTVTWATSNGTATAGQDYTAVTDGSLTFSPGGALSQTISVPITNDKIDEPDETFTVTLSNAQNATLSGGQSTLAVNGTITDDDERGITVDPTTLTITEGSNKTYEVELTSQPTGDVTVAVATSADSDADVTVSPTSLTFTTGNWGDAQTVTVSAAQDNDAANDAATVEHTISGGDYGANNVTASDVSVTVNDDETTSTSITLSVNPETVAENVGTSGQVVTVTATLDAGARTTATTVTISVAGGTASATDFASVSDITVTIAAQNTSNTGTFTLTPVDDDVDEENETVTVSGTVTGLTVNGTTVTITDDDEATYSLSISDATIEENGGTSTVTLSTDGVSFTTDKTFVLALGGNAAKGTDYTVGSESLTLTAGQTSVETTVTATDDKVDEANETITVSASLNGNAVGSSQTLTITDDDTRGVTVNPTSLTVAEGSSKTYEVKLDSEPTAAVTVGVATSSDSDADVTVSTTSLTFTTSNWSTAQTVTVSAAEDNDAQNDAATVEHTINGGDYGTNNVTADDVSVTVNDDETTSTSITLSVNPETVAENVGASGQVVTVTAALDAGARTTATTVTVSVTAGTASTGDFAAVSDFPVTIAAQATNGTGTFTLKPVDDSVDESDETVTVNGTASGLTVNGTTVTITDDDTRGVTISPTALTITEGSSKTYEVELDSQPTVTVTVAIATTTSSDADVTVSPTSLTFTTGNWSTAQTVTVTAAQDADATNDAATVEHTVSGADYGTNNVEADDVTVTVNDDETASSSVALSVSPTTVAEDVGASGQEVTVTAALDAGARTTATTVTISVAGGTASTGDFASVSDITVTIAAQATSNTGTFTLKPVDDAVDESDETVLVSGTVTGLTVNGTTVTITDDDTRGVTISPTALTITEGSNKTYTVVLTSQPTADVTVTVGGASGDVSVSGSPMTFTLSTWSTAQTGTVSVAEDNDAVADDKVTLTHAVTGGDYGSVTASDVEVTITENDTPTLSIAPASAGEGDGSMVFTVTLSVASSNAVTVTYATSNGTATAGEDYTAMTATTLTFSPNGSLTQTVTVSVTDDKIDEEDETLTVTLSNAQNATLSGGQSTLAVTGTITDDDERGVTVSESSLTITEGSNKTYEVELDSQPTGNVTVAVATSTDSDADVTVSPTSLTFTTSNWSTEQTVTVSAAEDADAVNDAATIEHTVTGADYGSNSVTASNVPVTVTDNETASTSVTLSVSPTTVAEDVGAAGQVITVTATLNGAPSTTPTTVTVSVGTGTASATDFAAVSNITITIAAQSTSGTGTFTITPVDDDVDEDDETVTVSGTASDLTVSGTTVTITDDDTRGVTVNPTALTITEGGSKTYEVELDSEPTGNVTVTVGGAFGDVSVSGSPMTFTASDWSTAQTVTVNVAEDNDAAPDPPVTLTHAVSGGDYGSVTASNVVVTITENDADTPTLRIAPASAGEGDGSMAFTVTLSTASSQTVTVRYATSNGTATAGQDYTASRGTLTFNPGQTERTIRVPVIDDDIVEDTETFKVALSNAQKATLGASRATGTIEDDDYEEVELKISIANAQADEGSGNIAFEVTLNEPTSDHEVTVNWATSDRTAIAGKDYTAGSGTLIFEIGEIEKTINVPIIDDTIDEGIEKFTVTLSYASNAILVTGLSDETLAATGTILDNDALPVVSIADMRVDENAGLIVFTARLSQMSAKYIKLSYATNDGTAISGQDYTAVSGFQTFESGETEKTIRVPIIDDNVYELDEAFEVTLSKAVNVTLAGPGIGTILDNDAPPVVSIADVRADESAGHIVFTARLNQVSNHKVTVDWATNDGTAISGQDYTAGSGMLVFEPSVTEQTIRVAIIDDNVDEKNETVRMILTHAVNSTLEEGGEATGTILDNDAPPVVSIANERADEGAGDIVFTARLNQVSSKRVTLSCVTANGTAIAGQDYRDQNEFLTFAPGQTEQTIRVAIIDDNVDEEDETFSMILADAVNVTLGNSGETLSATGTIVDNDASPVVSMVDVRADEGAGNIAFTARLNQVSSKRVTLSCVTSNGTAIAGLDYRDQNGGVTFNPGQTEQTISVPIIDDNVDEENETFSMILKDAVNVTLENGGETLSATGTIMDNDAFPTGVAIAVAPETVPEDAGETSINVTATLSGGSTLPVPTQVVVSVTDGTASSADYTATTATVTIPATASSSVASLLLTPVDDRLDEEDETIKIVGRTADLDVTGSEVIIVDNDAPPVVSMVDVRADEGDGDIAFTARLSQTSGKKVTLSSVTANGTAMAGQDYTALNGGVTFIPGVTEQTIRVAIIDDSVDEENEIFRMILKDAVNVTLENGEETLSATGMIVDNDDRGVTVNPTTLTIPEGNDKTYTVVLTSQPTADVTVSVTIPQGTNVMVDKTALVFTAKTWNTAQTVTVSAAKDADAVADAVVRIEQQVNGGDYDGETAQSVMVTVAETTIPAFLLRDVQSSERNGQMVFEVWLNVESSERVTADYATIDGTANAEEDYATASGTLTFEPGEMLKTVRVVVIDDLIGEDGETFSLSLSNPVNSALTEGDTATGTIVDDDAGVAIAWLTRFGRTVASQVVDAVSQRLIRTGGQASHLTVGGQRVLGGAVPVNFAGQGLYRGGFETPVRNANQAISPYRFMEDRDILTRSSFHLSSGQNGGAGWTAWGLGVTTQFTGQDADLSLNGRVLTGLLGVDYERGRVLAGVAVSQSHGDGDLSLSDLRNSSLRGGNVNSFLTGVNPYLRVALGPRLLAWGLAGYGQGEMSVIEGDGTDIKMRMGAFGAHGSLLPPDTGAFGLAIKSDAFRMLIDSESGPGVLLSDADASRVRLILEGSHNARLASNKVLGSTLEMGARRDGGEAETGLGIEVGGWLRFADPGRGLTVEATARSLLAHQDSKYEEWGIGGSIIFNPSASERGLSVRIRSSWGAATSGIHGLWSQQTATGFVRQHGIFGPTSTFNMELNYGMSALGNRMFIVPYANVSLLNGGKQDYRLGGRMKIWRSLSLNIESGFGNGAAQQGWRRHMLRGSLQWFMSDSSQNAPINPVRRSKIRPRLSRAITKKR